MALSNMNIQKIEKFQANQIIKTEIDHLKNVFINVQLKKKKITFEPTPLMPTYLVSFAIVDFDCIESLIQNNGKEILIRAFSPQGKIEQVNTL